MKHFLSFIFISILLAGSITANENTAFKVTMLIEDGLKQNQQQIMKLAPDLTGMEKMLIYNDNQQKPAWPLIGNLVLGAGIGSFIQGDTKGGLIGLGGEIVGFSLLVLPTFSENLWENPDLGDALMITGFGVIFVTRIFELIRPFTYSKQYNSLLRDVLTISNLTFEPLAIPGRDRVSCGGVLKIHL